MPYPDLSNLVPRREISIIKSKNSNYMKVCFIFDGVQYQDQCIEEKQDGTFNYSEKCLTKLSSDPLFIGFENNNSLSSDNALVRYTEPEPSEFPDILKAISHYWIEVLMLCILSALLFNIAFLILRRRSNLYSNLINFYKYGRLSKDSHIKNRLSAGPSVDEQGTISIGKISFNPKSVLGFGSKGTCVFRGEFEASLKCAVKRIVSQYLSLADREVEFLRSLQHPNLVRYLATEEDAQFIYIALELAEFTLADLIEKRVTNEIGLSREDLCHQSALGLQHLHKLNIVHRDIKPHNILVSFPMKPNDERKVMISDFGLSKQLSNLDTGHTSSAMRYFDGTQGWMAPEIVNAKLSEDKSLLPTKSADIFSLGCVFYYILSDGEHPFGRVDQRQSNILKNINQLDLFSMTAQGQLKVSEAKAVMASVLIKSMIQPSHPDRPPIGSVLKYPFFWRKAHQLQFLLDVSDRIDKLELDNDLMRSVEHNRQRIFAYGWKEALCPDLRNNLCNFRTYNGRLVCHLLRAIRNKKHHYRELSDELKSSLGDLPHGFMDYFSSRFPELLPHVYQAMQKCRDEPEFKSYYEPLENFEFI